MSKETDLAYIDSLECQRFTADENNRTRVDDFQPVNDCRLDNYLKEKAWEDDLDNETRVYLVKISRKIFLIGG